MSICKHCSRSFVTSELPKGWMANHSRWCDSNPKRSTYSKNTSKMRAGITEASRRKQAASLSKFHATGISIRPSSFTFQNRIHSEETKTRIRTGALKSKHRRLKKNTIMYNGVMLDSTWELALAKRLDFLSVKWTRPSPLEWVDEHLKVHNYFPDFYLPDYDKYLDPKNPHALAAQKTKVDIILKLYPNIHILGSLAECENYLP